jgi:RNA polymerase I-specific transcription initiation factor RRN6
MPHHHSSLHQQTNRTLSPGIPARLTYSEDDMTRNSSCAIDPRLRQAIAGKEVRREDSGSAFPLWHLSSKEVYSGCRSQPESQADDVRYDGTNASTPGPSRILDANGESARPEEYNSQSNPVEFDRPNCGDFSELLQLGGAVSVTSRSRPSDLAYIPIAASISGIDGGRVRLIRIGEEILTGLENRRLDTPLRLPCIPEHDPVYWSSKIGQVQQICFAAMTGYASTWMAVRLPSSTVIFHPREIQNDTPPEAEPTDGPFRLFASSKLLDPNPTATIPISRTGGHPHIDVAFHPQNHSKLAIVDKHGNWSTWFVEDGQQKGEHGSRVTLLCSGKIWTWDHEQRLRTSVPYHDGWHRVFWFGSSDDEAEGLLVLNRQTAAVYRSTGEFVGLIQLRIGYAQNKQSILDIRPILSVRGHFLVLTSAFLFLLCSGKMQSGESVKEPGLPRVLTSWQHFRDIADKTLRVVVLEMGPSRS